MHSNRMDGSGQNMTVKHCKEWKKMKKWPKILKITLAVLLLASAAVYPGFMAMMSASGWVYNVREGNYPEVFRSFAGWMYAGGGLLCIGALLAVLSMKPKRWILAPAALGCAGSGLAASLSSLYRFTAYADQHFSGIGDSMQPVSDLYRDRLLPVILPAVLTVIFAAWNLLSEETRDYRSQKRAERLARENAPAPKIIE